MNSSTVSIQEPIPRSVSILGIPVSVFDSYEDALELIQRRILLRIPTFCMALNSEKVHRATRDPKLRKMLGLAQIRICDGVGISLGAMLLLGRHIPRCTGIDLFLRVVRVSAEQGWKAFVLGASPEVNEIGCQRLMTTYPGLRIVGRQHGFFTDSNAVIEAINNSGAEVLFVAMGSPRQEFWISENMPRLSPLFCMGIGGSLDVVSGATRRAPAFFQKTGTEWLFRTLYQPRRWRRALVNALFAWDVFIAMGLGRQKSPTSKTK